MLKVVPWLLCALFLTGRAVAQRPDDEYYPYDRVPEERAPELQIDTALFYRAIQTAEDLFAVQTDYALSFVAFKRRGLERARQTVSLDGIGLPVRYAGALRMLGLDEARYAGGAVAATGIGITGSVHAFSYPEAQRPASRYAAVSFTDRNYLARMRFAAGGRLGRGWEAAVAADVRTGRDSHVDGVFTHSLSLSLEALKRFGDDHRMALLLLVPAGMRGVRSSSVAEAFEVLDDPLYNPAWGYQNGKVRNSRVRRECLPLAAASYRGRLSAATSLLAAVGMRAGVNKYSMLGWYDAQTPMPDNYRYLPGYAGDPETDAAWRTNDTRRTQIDWDELWQQNRMTGRAVYALEDRVERVCEVQGNLSFTTELDDRLTLCYGMSFRRMDSRNYKQMRDLLGAPFLTDIDQYLVDDDTYGNKLQNDLRHPNRKIRKGDRFGYDYNLTAADVGVRLRLQYRSDRLYAEFAAESREASIRRRGNYEKELFAGNRSYGKSRRLRFTPYRVKGSVGWAFSPRSYLEAVFLAAAEPSAAEEYFLQPQYSNRTIDRPEAEKIYSAEVNYRFSGRSITLQVAGYVASTLAGTQTSRYYDDLSASFSDLVATGIGKRVWGLEIAARWRVSYRWSLSLCAAAGRFGYNRDPRVTIFSDADHTVVDSRAVSYMGGCFIGGAPQLSGCAELAYFGPKGWGVRTSASYAGRRYVEPALLRRTERIARQAAASPEAFRDFVVQERLDDAFTLDASLFKSFYFVRTRLTASLMLRNLLGDRRTCYNGYESMRVGRRRSGDTYVYQPHATRYTSVYPRSIYVTVSYNF